MDRIGLLQFKNQMVDAIKKEMSGYLLCEHPDLQGAIQDGDINVNQMTEWFRRTIQDIRPDMLLDPRPLSEEERAILERNGWAVNKNGDYTYLPDDEDGQMASGVSLVRWVVRSLQRKEGKKP